MSMTDREARQTSPKRSGCVATSKRELTILDGKDSDGWRFNAVGSSDRATWWSQLGAERLTSRQIGIFSELS